MPEPSGVRHVKPDKADLAAAQPAAARRLNLSAMRSGAVQVKTQRAKNHADHKQKTKLRLVKKPIDWSELDQVGRPVVSFDPADPNRLRALKIIKRDARDRTRQEVVKKLGVEFSRIYERYRRDAERRKTGRSYTLYEVQEREQKSCEEAAVNCILRGVTPRQLLEYWDANIKNYTNHNLVIPSLNFLKAPSAIDRVACSALGTVGRIEKTRQSVSEDTRVRPETRNTFSGVGGLDIRLRPALEAAGFATQSYNDRYLLSIQHNALAIAAGKSIFLAAGRVRNMAKHAAKTLYAKG